MIRTLYALLLALAMATAAITPGSAAPSLRLPGDRSNFVVATARLAPGAWTRLGTYHFDTDGTVTANTYHWKQKSRPKPLVRVPVGAKPSGVDCAPGSRTKRGSRPCQVMTAAGFTGKAPSSAVAPSRCGPVLSYVSSGHRSGRRSGPCSLWRAWFA
ncbi:hypothetical protein [Streptomyces sp. NPDC050548]|uniref:hypothetical protein n=1 Tax=Streptomyces sp. NPDC050548 TaxID=3365629 RepID=UPI003795FA49